MNDPLTQTFAALSDPTRRAILKRLMDGEATVQELAEPFPISQPAISKHLKVLETAGLVERREEATRRYARIRGEPLKEIIVWTTEFQRLWDERFARLDDLLEADPDDEGGQETTRRRKRR